MSGQQNRNNRRDLRNRKVKPMICKVWNCKELATREAIKLNDDSYSQPYGYCEKHAEEFNFRTRPLEETK